MPPTAEQAPQAQTDEKPKQPAGQPPAPAKPEQTARGEHAGDPPPAPAEPEQVAQDEQGATTPKPGFGERGRMRRRARFLRKARELAYRDLGGLVYELHRFGQRNDQVVLAKLATLGNIDTELRALEHALHDIRPVTVLREVGIAACPRCAAIHGNEDRFCPGCGLAFAAGADRPLSTAPVTPAPQPDAAAAAPVPQTPPRPAAEPLTAIERAHERPAAPALRPTATPVAARQPASEGRDGDRHGEDGKRDPEDEPTQILHPPAGGA